ncbi:hypothetical protein EW026_g3571 [Hermanssonia centrifuga]|uniref:E3 ubiquitin-protein ligase synoviolin-like TPR repeats domain-containing protein n=1 Tax=Hermanssonia centrifuga TaxID=98765 RepID=A0A4S4KKA4_9APHY|nr:hypothetical protein EW026_g3571 [Hermanssonia centrifuga]
MSLILECRIVQRIFFGPLQPREIERLYDQTWMFVTESLLAFTIFRDDFDIPFVIMFGFLLFIKCFHWLMADRMESMDQVPYPGPPLLFHVRINSLFLILWLVDFVMLAMAIDSTLTNGVGGMVLFANEYAILMASALNSMARYTLSNLDMRRARTRGGANAPAWENKSMYIFYIELVTAAALFSRPISPAGMQPGAAPQQPQAGQQAANGPLVLGWLARFMGIAAQPPLVPGQFPNAPFPQFVPGGPQQIPANAGWPAPGQQLPPGYAYPFQYQMQPPVQLQPPPIYRGFYGPGGVWQPWGMDAQALAQGQQAPANQPQPQTHQQPQPVASPLSQAAAPGLSADQSQGPTRIPPVDGPQAESSNFPTPSDTDSAPATDRPSTPREAAALAALRRHNSPQTSVTIDIQQPASVVPSNDGAVTDITNAPSTSPPSEMPLEASASAFTAASASGSASTSTTIPENRVEIPSLIPLYDLGSYAQPVRIVPQIPSNQALQDPLKAIVPLTRRHPAGQPLKSIATVQGLRVDP